MTAFLSFADPPTDPMRTWTDAEGTQQVQAEYVTFQDEKVWLHRDDGRVFGVPLSALSQPDRQFVRDEIRKRETRKAQPTPHLPGRIDYARGRTIAYLAAEDVDESSGLARSQNLQGAFWTHNDSGDKARIYLFDRAGRDLGSCLVENVFAYDWEDIAAFQRNGKPCLLIGDCGNNGLAADIHTLYLVEEPRIDPQKGLLDKSIPVVQPIHFSFDDDNRDCEAIAVDPTSDCILLATKQRGHETLVYELPWPQPNAGRSFPARRIATLDIPPATAMDVSPDGRRAVILSYDNAYEFVRLERQSWADAFAAPPREIVVPERIQGESICYGSDGKTLYLTSEKRPTPLIEIPAEEKPPAR